MNYLIYSYLSYFALLLFVALVSFLVCFVCDVFLHKSQKIGFWKQIIKGLFYTDETQVFANILRLIQRHFWEFPQVFLGFVLLHVQLIRLKNFDVSSYKSITTGVWYNSPKRMGISLGAYIFIWENTNTPLSNQNSLYLHEHGHTFDSRLFGPFYLIIIGLPSLLSATWRSSMVGEPFGVSSHSFRWYEMRANRHAAQMLWDENGKKWDERETYYPRQKRNKNKRGKRFLNTGFF